MKRFFSSQDRPLVALCLAVLTASGALLWFIMSSVHRVLNGFVVVFDKAQTPTDVGKVALVCALFVALFFYLKLSALEEQVGKIARELERSNARKKP